LIVQLAMFGFATKQADKAIRTRVEKKLKSYSDRAESIPKKLQIMSGWDRLWFLVLGCLFLGCLFLGFAIFLHEVWGGVLLLAPIGCFYTYRAIVGIKLEVGGIGSKYEDDRISEIAQEIAKTRLGSVFVCEALMTLAFLFIEVTVMMLVVIASIIGALVGGI